MNIRPLPFSLDVVPLQTELAIHPEAWDLYTWRTQSQHSPHRECSDIWVRYNALENFGPRFNEEHESTWYPIASIFPSVEKLVAQLCERVSAKRLGGILLTKVPAGRQVYPHIDRGWHASYYEKFAVLVEGNHKQRFCFEDGFLGCSEGNCFWFRNDVTHWVTNRTSQDRITLIICARTH